MGIYLSNKPRIKSMRPMRCAHIPKFRIGYRPSPEHYSAASLMYGLCLAVYADDIMQRLANACTY